jgi:hypothetical protein
MAGEYVERSTTPTKCERGDPSAAPLFSSRALLALVDHRKTVID